jgi:hypothetical protein
MDYQQWQMKEFECLRQELHGRIIFLHRTINLAIALWVVFTIAVFHFLSVGLAAEYMVTLLLLIPLIFDLLGYNYQSNQNSLESISKYIHEVLRPQVQEMNRHNILEWERFFAIQKHPFKFESSFKIYPFIMPSFIPLILIAMRVPLHGFHRALVAVDLLFLGLLLENFRYKFRRVK